MTHPRLSLDIFTVIVFRTVFSRVDVLWPFATSPSKNFLSWFLQHLHCQRNISRSLMIGNRDRRKSDSTFVWPRFGYTVKKILVGWTNIWSSGWTTAPNDGPWFHHFMVATTAAPIVGSICHKIFESVTLEILKAYCSIVNDRHQYHF